MRGKMNVSLAFSRGLRTGYCFNIRQSSREYNIVILFTTAGGGKEAVKRGLSTIENHLLRH